MGKLQNKVVFSGTHEMGGGELLRLGDNVKLQGQATGAAGGAGAAAAAAASVLRWGANTGIGPTASLISGTEAVGASGRYAVEGLAIAIESPCKFVIDVSVRRATTG
jgi:hypothetical protein